MNCKSNASISLLILIDCKLSYEVLGIMFECEEGVSINDKINRQSNRGFE